MWRMVAVWAGGLMVLSLAGCTMCCHPYDHCGPVYENGCHSCSQGRVGSILEGGEELLPVPNTPSPTPAPPKATSSARSRQPQSMRTASVRYRQPSGQAVSPTRSTYTASTRPKAGDVPGSQKIISVTERTVTDPNTPVLQPVSESEVDDSKTLPASGWTARRPTSEVVR